MKVNIHTVLLNVADLDKSVEFYGGVFDFPVIGQRGRATALLVNEDSFRQVLVLREVGPNALHPGRGSLGPRVFGFEVDSAEELELVEQRLKERRAPLTHTRRDTWEAILGSDPDRIEFVAASSLTGTPISRADWRDIDSMVFAMD
jgi:catechol-2,3-dioxygenase